MRPLLQIAVICAVLLAPTFIKGEDSSSNTTPPSNSNESTNKEESDKPTVREIDANESDNLISNGNFTEAKSGWRGFGTVVERNGKKMLEVKLRGNSKQTVSFVFKLPRDVEWFALRFNVEGSADLSVKDHYPIEAWIYHGMSGSGQPITLTPGGANKGRHRFRINDGSREAVLTIEVKPGDGYIYFSDFYVGVFTGKI